MRGDGDDGNLAFGWSVTPEQPVRTRSSILSAGLEDLGTVLIRMIERALPVPPRHHDLQLTRYGWRRMRLGSGGLWNRRFLRARRISPCQSNALANRKERKIGKIALPFFPAFDQDTVVI